MTLDVQPLWRRTDERTWLKLARVDAWMRQKGRCRYCLWPIRRAEITADHFEPSAKGGSDQPHNIAAAHQPCNRAKGAIPGREFLHMLNSDGPLPYEIAVIRLMRRLAKRLDRACATIAASVRVA